MNIVWTEKKEDFELQVSSPGLDQPFVVINQYLKNLGNKVTVTTKSNTVLIGELLEANKKEITLKEIKIINPDKGDLEIWLNREIVPDNEVEDEATQIAYTDALKIEPDFEVGEEVSQEIKVEDFGRKKYTFS